MAKRSYLAVFLIFVAANVGMAATAADYVNSGVAKYKKGDIEGALRDFNKAIELEPDDAFAYCNRGVVEDDNGDFNGAIKDYDKAIELKPDYADAYMNRSASRGVKGDIDGSIRDCDKAIELKPDDAEAYGNRGIAKNAKGDIDGAINDFNKFIELKPDDPRTYYNRGKAKIGKGDRNGAIKDYDKAIELKPDYAKAYNGRGNVNYDSGKWREALLDFKKCIELDPSNDYAHLRIWLVRSRLGEKEGVDRELQDFLTARKGKPDDWVASIGAFLVDRVREEIFLKTADNADETKRKGQQCEAYFYAGSKRLIEGDKLTAQSYFESCVATGRTTFYEYASAGAELLRLKGGEAK